jgi:hypothetical protein
MVFMFEALTSLINTWAEAGTVAAAKAKRIRFFMRADSVRKYASRAKTGQKQRMTCSGPADGHYSP